MSVLFPENKTSNDDRSILNPFGTFSRLVDKTASRISRPLIDYSSSDTSRWRTWEQLQQIDDPSWGYSYDEVQDTPSTSAIEWYSELRLDPGVTKRLPSGKQTTSIPEDTGRGYFMIQYTTYKPSGLGEAFFRKKNDSTGTIEGCTSEVAMARLADFLQDSSYPPTNSHVDPILGNKLSWETAFDEVICMAQGEIPVRTKEDVLTTREWLDHGIWISLCKHKAASPFSNDAMMRVIPTIDDLDDLRAAVLPKDMNILDTKAAHVAYFSNYGTASSNEHDHSGSNILNFFSDTEPKDFVRTSYSDDGYLQMIEKCNTETTISNSITDYNPNRPEPTDNEIRSPTSTSPYLRSLYRHGSLETNLWSQEGDKSITELLWSNQYKGNKSTAEAHYHDATSDIDAITAQRLAELTQEDRHSIEEHDNSFQTDEQLQAFGLRDPTPKPPLTGGWFWKTTKQ